MWKGIASNGLTVLIVLLAVAAIGVGWARQAYTGPGPLAEAVCFRVERGANLTEVSEALADQGVVASAPLFRIGADYQDRSGDLRFGSYLIAPGASMAAVLDDLTAGGQSTCGREINFRVGVIQSDVILRELDPATGEFVEVARFDPAAGAAPAEYVAAAAADDVRMRVTVAEGTTSWQVVDALGRVDVLTGEVAEVPPEGTLAPDSYEIERGGARAELIARMSAAQAARLAEAWAARAEGLPYASPEEALIMASIIEKETSLPEERARVAAVFVNRLREGMRLQTDPTVIYGITEGQGVLGRGLRQSELRRETPWNTYVIDGLPPTPIANPGRDSIRAALNPEASDYLFFVADGSGGHAFARTLEEHNANVARWREIEAQQGRAEEGGVQTD